MRRCFVFLALLLLCSPLHARSLHWSSIDVDASIDRDGVLEVAETQTFVFDGDWNGGERRFNVRHMQSLELLGVEHIDGDNIIPMKRGNLAVVDGYAINAEKVLRWRSRLPSDPPFENAVRTYRIRYRLRGVLRGRNDEYRLDHDFLFPDRSGVVQRFSLRLRTDPAWGGIEPVLTRNARGLVPGEGYIVTRDLTWKGSGKPSAVTELPNPFLGRIVIALIVLGIAALAFRFFRNESERGRFGGLTPTSEIDDEWLETNVFKFSPEAIGAAWDGKVGAPEVAAVIASLAQDGKIETNVEKRMLRSARLKMKLLCDRRELEGHHGEVARKLFFSNRKETDTDAIRTYYKSSGLDLASIIRDPIEDELSDISKWTSKAKVANWKLDIGLLIGAVILAIVIAAVRGGNDAALIASMLFFGVFSAAGSLIAARVNYNALTKFPLRVAIVAAFLIPLLYGLLSYLVKASEYLFGLPAMLACAFFVLALVNLVLTVFRTDQSAQKIAFRKKIISARRYFLEQLQSAEPRLRDEWFPYLLGLGLGSNVESWFKSYGSDKSYESYGTYTTNTTNTTNTTSTTTSWTGGGGSFGGAGATGSWALAAAAVGAGVSAPSSSSGGGSSSNSSSSSSSGGGGGGGW